MREVKGGRGREVKGGRGRGQYIDVGVSFVNFVYNHNTAEACHTSHVTHVTCHMSHVPVFCKQEVALHLPQQNTVGHHLHEQT